MKRIKGEVVGNITIEEDTEISGEVQGNVHVEECTLEVSGTVKGIIYAGEGATLEMTGDCEEIRADAADVTIDGVVYGDVYYRDTYLEIGENARIDGEVINENEDDTITHYEDEDFDADEYDDADDDDMDFDDDEFDDDDDFGDDDDDFGDDDDYDY